MHPAQPGGGREGGDGGGPAAYTHGDQAPHGGRLRGCLARADRNTGAPCAGTAGHHPGHSVGIGPEDPAGTGRGDDVGAAVVGGAAAAASTAGAGPAAEVNEHVGQEGGPRVAGAVGSGGPAEAGAAADVVPSINVGNPAEPDEDKDRGASTRSESSQANVKTVDTGSTPGGEHELAESKPDKESEGV